MTWKAERGPWLSIPASSSPATACILLFVFFLSLSAPFAQAIIQLDNSCPWGDKYIQFVGFPCLPEEERLRDPDGAWSPFWVYYNSDIKGLSVANYQMNRLGIHLGNETYCANFTVRQFWVQPGKQGPPWALISIGRDSESHQFCRQFQTAKPSRALAPYL